MRIVLTSSGSDFAQVESARERSWAHPQADYHILGRCAYLFVVLMGSTSDAFAPQPYLRSAKLQNLALILI